MRNKWHSRIKDERGAVEIVEAALIYPFVFFVVILFIFLGNLFYQQSKVDAIAVRAAERLAVYYTNPLLRGKGLPTSAETVRLDPYRYLFGSNDAETAVEKFVDSELANSGSGAFMGMEINKQSVDCEIDNKIVYQTAKVQIQYTVELVPLKLFGGVSIVSCSVATATSAADPAEFIRNIDMILDYADISGLTEKIKETVGRFTGK